MKTLGFTLILLSWLFGGGVHALTLTDAGAWVPGKMDRREDLTGAPYETAELKSDDGAFQAQAKVSLGYNHLRVEMYDPDLSGNWAETKSYWRDVITITVPSSVCALGEECSIRAGAFLNFTLFDYETSWFWYDLSVGSAAGSGARVHHDDNDVCYGNTGWCTFSRMLEFDLQFDNGKPLDTWAGMYGGASSDSGRSLGYVDAYHTAAFSYLDLPPGSVVTSASGTAYPVPYTPPVPELGSQALMTLGLAALATLIGRRAPVRRNSTRCPEAAAGN